MNTCFAILLGDISVNDDLNQLQGLQGVAATLFFWSFELLVFMVLLNFLLAIIVDAFSEVKENTHETTGMTSLCFLSPCLFRKASNHRCILSKPSEKAWLAVRRRAESVHVLPFRLALTVDSMSCKATGIQFGNFSQV